MKRSRFSRRQFLKGAAAAGAAAVAAPYVIPTNAFGGAGGRPAPSNRLVMGAIGLGMQGTNDNRAFLGYQDVQMVAVCDLHPEVQARFKNNADQAYGNTDWKTYWDFQEIIARKDIDVIHMAVPDHWHAYISIAVMLSGKDVYCQKPLSLTLREGREMIKHARRTGRVFSCGSQRVWDDYYNLHKLARTGALGEIKEASAFVGGPSKPCDLPSTGDPPAGFNFDRWLGPAPLGTYNPERISGSFAINGHSWRSFREYSGGDTTDWGGHLFGACLYALGLEKQGPISVDLPNGGDRPNLTFTFANGMKVYHVNNGQHNISVTGTLGTQRGNPQGAKGAGGGAAAAGWAFEPYHGESSIYRDFLHCVRTRERPFQDVEVAHRACSMCHLSIIANILGRSLKWDPDNEVFIGDDGANQWLDRPKRAPWSLPGA